MVYKLCNVESAIATCDSYNYKPKLRREKHHRHDNHRKLRHFSHTELNTATNGFSNSAILGKGSHGVVYKAVLDGGSLIAAVKKPTAAAKEAAVNELEILSRVRHKRIVNLIGYANKPDPNTDTDTGMNMNMNTKIETPLLLVVEYMQNGSLYDLLHTRPDPITFPTRIRIALHVAEAVRALHGSDPVVIHRDIKSCNVLPLLPAGGVRATDQTPPAGTMGYLDPGYLAPANAGARSDVYSFGVLLLEIISGRRAIDVSYSPPSITEWALPLIRVGDYTGIVDRRIDVRDVDPTVVRELAMLAARCVRSTAEMRPGGGEVVECIKMVYKKVKWDFMRWHVRSTGGLNSNLKSGSGSKFEVDGSSDCEERYLNLKKNGNRRKVSSVASPEDRVAEMAPRVKHRTLVLESKSKSKSVRSFREIKAVPEDQVGEMVTRVKHRTVALKSKSKSVGSFREIKVGPEDRVGEMVTRVKHPTMLLKSKSKSVGSFREIKVGSEDRVTRVEHRGGSSESKLKSKSVGSFREIKVGLDPVEGSDCEIIKSNVVNHVVNNGGNNKRPGGQVRVKLCNVVKLSKSRSMSVLPCSKNVSQYHGNGSAKKPEVKEFDILPLLVNSSCSNSCSPKHY